MATRLWPCIAAFMLTLVCATGVLVAAGLSEEAASPSGPSQHLEPSRP